MNVFTFLTRWFIAGVALLLLPSLVEGQSGGKKVDSVLVGLWKGTSICQIKNSPCHDEIVVYHISRTDTADIFRMAMNKIVNGAEEEMGALTCTYHAKDQLLVSREFNGDWKFHVEGRRLSGTLWYKGRLYRIIRVARVQDGQ